MLEQNEKRSQSIKKAIEILETTTELSLKKKFSFMPILQGKPGIAKTTLIKEMAKKNNYELISISGMKPMEYFSGLPITDKLVSENGDVGEAIWTKPELIAKANRVSNKNKEHGNKKGVIVFIDDIHLLGDASKYFFELILDGSLNGHSLNDDIVLIGAANDSDLSSYEGFSAAVINRMMLIPVHLEFKDWYKSIGVSLNTYITTFLKTTPIYRSEQEDQNKPFGSYRSWTEFAILFDELTKNNENESEIVKSIAHSFVSKEALDALYISIETQKKIDFKELLKRNIIELPTNDNIEQILYTIIIRYAETQEEFSKITKMILESSKKESHEIFLINIIMELLSLQSYYENNNENNNEIDEEILININNMISEIQENDKIQTLILECF